jgi:hypothetical protein
MALVLSPDATGVGWQGATNAKLKIQVVPKITTIRITIDDADYPGSTDLVVTGDTATSSVVNGRSGFTVHIAPRHDPPIVFSVIEVGNAGDQQTLISVNDPFPAGDLFGTTITITGI